MNDRVGVRRFLHLFSVSILSQAIVSAGSLTVGLLLIRRQNDAQYGYYVLVIATLMLLSGLQGGFVQPAMLSRMASSGELGRRELIGGLLRERRRVMLMAAVLAMTVIACLWVSRIIDGAQAILGLAAVFAAVAALNRDFFRMVLMGYQRPIDVLRADIAYACFAIGGAYLATFSPFIATTAVATLGVSGLVGSALLARALWKTEPWIIDGAKGIVRDIAPTGTWAVSGVVAHWAFSQGYAYLVAAMLDVHAVAAMAATRLPLMPVNLLSLGIMQIMLPTASKWLATHGAAQLHRRLLALCLGVSMLALIYFGLMWLARGWIFSTVLKKDFANRDTLLILWSLIHLLMLLRDQLAPLLVAMERLATMTTLTLASAALALTTSYIGIRESGMAGALVGVMLGEAVNVGGFLVISRMVSRQATDHRPEPGIT